MYALLYFLSYSLCHFQIILLTASFIGLIFSKRRGIDIALLYYIFTRMCSANVSVRIRRSIVAIDVETAIMRTIVPVPADEGKTQRRPQHPQYQSLKYIGEIPSCVLCTQFTPHEEPYGSSESGLQERAAPKLASAVEGALLPRTEKPPECEPEYQLPPTRVYIVPLANQPPFS